MSIKETIKHIEFPITNWALWDTKIMDWAIKHLTLEDWDDVYQNLMVKNEKKTVMDFHPNDVNDRWKRIGEVTLLVGTEFDIWTYKERFYYEPYPDMGLFNMMRFYQKELTVYIDYIDYEGIEKWLSKKV